MKYKSREQKEYERRIAAYDERIESAKQRLISASSGPEASGLIVCRASTFEPVGISASGALVVGGYNIVKVHASEDEATRTAIRANKSDSSSIHIVMTLSNALSHHIEWLKNRKLQAVQLHGQMIRKQNEALGSVKRNSVLPWWKRV